MVSRIVVPSAASPSDEVPELPPRLRVEPGGRLVEEDQLRPPDDAQGDVDPPPLTAGELPDARPRLLGQPDHGDDLVGVARVAVVAGEVAHRLADGELGGVVGGLQHDADSGPARRRWRARGRRRGP